MPIAPLRRFASAAFGATGHVFVASGLIAAFSSLPFAAPAFAQAPPDIAHLAPKRAFLVVSVPDFGQLKSAFDKSALGDLWHEPEVMAFVEEVTKEEAKKFTDLLQDIGIRIEDLKPPTGEVGLAMFMPDSPPRPAGQRPGDNADSPQPQLLAVADMGANADGLQDSLDRLLDRAVKDKRITTEEDTYAGAKITTVKPIIDESKKKKFKPPRPNPPEGDEEQPPEDQNQPSGLDQVMNPLGNPREMHLSRSGSSFLVCTDRKCLESALDAIGGGGKGGDSLADEPNYQGALAQLPQAGLLHAVLMAEPVIDLVRQDMAASSPTGDPALPGKVLDAMGFGAIKAFSLGARLDTPDGTLDLSFGVLAPEKKGLLTLFSQPLGPFDPPGFVPPDAAEVMRFSFRFDGLFDLLRAMAASMPEPTRQQMSAALDAGTNIVKPALDTAGPAVHTLTTYRQPFAPDSEATTIAIDVRDQGTILNTLAFATGQLKGVFEPRDFEGNTIYASDAVTIAIGVGFNRLFIGPVAGVENAMRLAGRADAPRITAEPAFREATRTLGDDTVLAQFYDISQHLKWTWWQLQNQTKADEDQVAAAPIPEDQKAEILKKIRENAPRWPDRLPPVQTVLKYLGDIASDLRATPDGFRGRTVMLRPAAK